MQKGGKERALRPAQHQRRPGSESKLRPAPVSVDPQVRGSGKLHGQVALITGGDSGIGRATAVAFAREGAHVMIAYLNEHDDAQETQRLVQGYGQECELVATDLGRKAGSTKAVERAVKAFGRIDILVNNIAVHYPRERIEDISEEQLLRTFRTNIFSYFYTTQAALKHLKKGASIINTTSVTAYRGSAHLIDYAATKGAIVSFTRSLSASLIPRGIRVNAVAPGPVWTPLIA